MTSDAPTRTAGRSRIAPVRQLLVSRSEGASGDARSIGRAVAVQLLAYLPKALSLYFLARLLTTAELGQFGVLTALMALPSAILPFGAWIGRRRPGAVGTVDRTDAAALALDGTALALVLLVALMPPVRHVLLRATGIHVSGATYCLAATAFATSAVISDIRIWVQSDLKYVRASLIALAPDMTWLPVFLVYAALAHPTLAAVMGAQALVSMITIAWSARWVPWSRLIAAAPRPVDLSRVSRFALPLAGLTVSIVVLGVVDRLVLGRYVSLESLGTYTFMYSVLGIASATGAVAGRYVTTSASAAANRSGTRAAARLLAWWSLLVAALPVLAALALLSLRQPIAQLIGKDLVPSPGVVTLTGIGLGLGAARAVLQIWFQITFRTLQLGFLELLIAGAYLAMLFPLARTHGLFGAALAMVFGNALALVVYAPRLVDRKSAFRNQPA